MRPSPSCGQPATFQQFAVMSSEYLYFSYGSNMSRDRLLSRTISRTIRYSEVYIARVKDYSLCFTLRGVPPLEPAFASIRENKGEEVCGVVYRLDSQSWADLLESEDVHSSASGQKPPNNSYWLVTVDAQCWTSDNQETVHSFAVQTLIANPAFAAPVSVQPYLLPSARYVGLLVTGAQSEKLPPAYIRKLQSIPVARHWQPSLLRSLMVLCFPLFFMSDFRIIRLIRPPLLRLCYFLFGAHEKAASQGNSVRMMLCKMGLTILYIFYAIPMLLILACSEQARKGRQIVAKMVLDGDVVHRRLIEEERRVYCVWGRELGAL